MDSSWNIFLSDHERALLEETLPEDFDVYDDRYYIFRAHYHFRVGTPIYTHDVSGVGGRHLCIPHFEICPNDVVLVSVAFSTVEFVLRGGVIIGAKDLNTIWMDVTERDVENRSIEYVPCTYANA